MPADGPAYPGATLRMLEMRKSPIPWCSRIWLLASRSLKCHHSDERGVRPDWVQYRWRPRAGAFMEGESSASFQAVGERLFTGAVKVAAARLSSWMGVGIS